MAEGALVNSEADLAVSTTGYADAGPEPGLVHFASARRDGPTIHRVERFGAIGRGPVRIASMRVARSEEHTSELQSLMRISYAVFCLKKKNNDTIIITT